MAMNAEWVGLLTAKLVMRRDRLTDAESAAAAIRESIIEANDEEARVRSASVEACNPPLAEPKSSRKATARGTAPPKTVQALSQTSGAKPDGEVTLRDRVRQLMADGVQRSTAVVAEMLGVPQEKVGDAMKRLEKMKELRRVSVGVYILRAKIPSGRSPTRGTRPRRSNA